MPKLTKITSWQGTTRTQHSHHSYSKLDSVAFSGERDDDIAQAATSSCSPGRSECVNEDDHRRKSSDSAGRSKRRTAAAAGSSPSPKFGFSRFRKPSNYDESCPLTTEQPNAATYSSSSSSSSSSPFPAGCSHPQSSSSCKSTRKVFRQIRYVLSRPLKKVKSHIKDSVEELYFQTRRTCRGIKSKCRTGLVAQIAQVLLVPWQAVRGILWVLLLICLEVAEILLSIVFAILYKTLKMVVTTLLVPVIIVAAIINAFR